VVITGGEGIGGNINVGGPTSVFSNTTPSTGPTTGTVVITGGEGIGGNINVGGSTSVFSNTTPSTGPTTGTVVITGGEGIGGNINVGGPTSVFSNTTPSTGPTTGTVVITGGEGIGGNINVGGSTSVFSGTTASTGPTTGTVVVKGGMGVAGNVNVTGNITGNNGTLSTITVSGTANIGVDINSGSVKVQSVSASATNTDILNVPSKNPSIVVTSSGINMISGNLTLGSSSQFVINSPSSTLNAVTANGDDTNTNITANNYKLVATQALTVNGGMGVKNNVYVGASHYVVSNISCGGTISSGAITSTGTITGSAFNATSDYRIKHEIQELDEAFTVDNLRPVKYLNTLNQREEIGFLAHEVQTTYPYLVTGDKDTEPLQTLNYIGLIGVLVNEIQMLKTRITVLENQ
jgi:hypothetical protein